MKKNLLLSLALLISALFANAQTAFEPNNTILQNTAQNTFTAPVTIADSITTSSPDDRDFLKIILPYCGSWKFNLINPNGSPCVLKMYLYNAQNTSNVIINSGGITFDFNAGIPNPVILNCGDTIYLQIDQTSGANLGAYSVEITADLNNDGWECNNNFSQSTLLPIDTIVTTMLWGYDFNGNGDRDYFKVVAPQCGVLNITASNIGGGAATNQDIKFTVFQPDSLTLIGTGAGSGLGCDNTSVSNSFLVQPGTVYIKIEDIAGSGNCQAGYDLSPIPFTLTFDFDISDTCECNNLFATACQVPINSTHQIKLWGMNSTLNPSGPEDRDYYSVIAPQCGVLNITASNIGGGAGSTSQDIKFTVFQPDSLTLIGTGAGSGLGCDNTSVSGSFLVQPGTIYIKIEDIAGSGNCQAGYDLSPNPFTLTFDFDTSDSCECNNTFATACQVQPNSSHQVKLWGKNNTLSIIGDEDRDYFSMIVPQCSQLNLTASNIGGGGSTTQDIRFKIYQPDTLTLIGTITSGGLGCDNATVSGSVVVQPGILYILIEDIAGSANCQGGYDLSNIPFNVNFGVSNCTGISELNDLIKFSIVPNPATDNFSVTINDNSINSKLKISNVIGENIYEQDFSNQSKMNIDVSKLSKGVYFVTVENSSGRTTKKFIKE